MTRVVLIVWAILMVPAVVSAVVWAIVENNVQQENIRLEIAGKKAANDVLEKTFSELPLDPRNFVKETVKNCTEHELAENKDRSEADAQAYCSCMAPLVADTFYNYHDNYDFRALVEKMDVCERSRGTPG